MIFDRENNREESSQNQSIETVDSDCCYFGFADDNELVNPTHESKQFKFESDLDKEIVFFSDFFTSRDTLKSIKNTKQFWLKHKINMPILYTFALMVMTISASSAYIERFFSVSGIVCTNKSLNMKDDLIIIRSMLKANYKLLCQLFETIAIQA